MKLTNPLHRGAFCQFPFRWIYYYSSNKSTGKKTGKTHLCAQLCSWDCRDVLPRANVLALALDTCSRLTSRSCDQCNDKKLNVLGLSLKQIFWSRILLLSHSLTSKVLKLFWGIRNSKDVNIFLLQGTKKKNKDYISSCVLFFLLISKSLERYIF